MFIMSKKSDWMPHDSLLCIQTGAKLSDEKRMRYDAREFYLKSRDEMAERWNVPSLSLTPRQLQRCVMSSCPSERITIPSLKSPAT